MTPLADIELKGPEVFVVQTMFTTDARTVSLRSEEEVAAVAPEAGVAGGREGAAGGFCVSAFGGVRGVTATEEVAAGFGAASSEEDGGVVFAGVEVAAFSATAGARESVAPDGGAFSPGALENMAISARTTPRMPARKVCSVVTPSSIPGCF
jgi:hypothetical protein